MTPSQRREFTVRNGAVTLHAVEEGNPDGPVMVLMHGWPDTHHLWDKVVPLLADRFRIVRYDSRGAGASTVPSRLADYRLGALADDFFAVLDAVSPTAPVHVLAHDWGSVEAWEAVTREGAERRVASFTSVSGPNLAYLGTWVRRALARPTPANLAGPLTQLASSWYTLLFHLPVAPGLVLRHGFARVWPRFVGLFDGTDPARIDTAPTLPRDMANGVNRYRANILPRLLSPRGRPTSVPVQLLVNQRDRAVHPSGYRVYGEFASDLRVREVDSGHWLPYSDPALVARLAVAFVDSLAGEAPGGAPGFSRASAGEAPGGAKVGAV